jgi:hypothetical protein
MNVHFLKDVALAVAQKQHLETVMKGDKGISLAGALDRPAIRPAAC